MQCISQCYAIMECEQLTLCVKASCAHVILDQVADHCPEAFACFMVIVCASPFFPAAALYFLAAAGMPNLSDRHAAAAKAQSHAARGRPDVSDAMSKRHANGNKW